MIAQRCLQQILESNKFKNTFASRVYLFFDLRNPRKYAASVKQNNQYMINMALQANQNKINNIKAKPAHNLFKNADHLQHLQEEQSLLKLISTEPEQQILGFIGEAEDSIAQIKSGQNNAFGEHSFIVSKDMQKGTTKLTPLHSTLATVNTCPSRKGEMTDSLNSFTSTLIHHSDISELQKNFHASQNAPHYFRQLKELLFGKQEPVKTGAEAGGAACCTITSLDELANIGQRIDHEHGEIVMPSNAGEGALTGFVSYASLAGMKIATDIFSTHHLMCTNIDKAIDQLKLSQLENSYQLKLPQFKEKAEAIDACHRFLLMQKHEAQFQKRVAGVLSGFCSLTILLGQFIAKLSPVGLYLLSAFGGLHFIHIGVELYKTCLDYRNSAGNQVEKQHYYKKIKNLSLALLGWGLYTAGTATLGTMSMGMFGLAIQSGAAPGIIIGGIVMLGLGIVSTLIFNNIVTSRRFFPALPMLSRLNINNPPTRKETQNKLYQAGQLRNISKTYRQATFKSMAFKNIAKNKALRYSNKTLLYLTLGLYPKPFMNNKFKIKAHITGDINYKDHSQTLNRLNALSALFETEKITNPKLKKDNFNTFEADIFADTKSVLEQAENKNIKNRLKTWIDLLENTPKSDQMMKILARKVLSEHRSIHMSTKDNAGVLGQFIPSIQKRTELKKRFTELFSQERELTEKIYEYDAISDQPFKITSKIPVDEETAGTIGRLFKTAPCCNANDDANNPVTGILNLFREQFIESAKSDEDCEKLEQLLLESVDQYLLYQARNNAKEDIALHANYLKCFQKQGSSMDHISKAENRDVLHFNTLYSEKS